MPTRSGRQGPRADLPDQRRTADRRTSVRIGDGQARGRRATDSSEARAAPDPRTPKKRRATRDGREPLVIYLRPESIRTLKIAALENDTTASAIVAEAVDGWLRAHGRTPRR